jgi:hypothetical protein
MLAYYTRQVLRRFGPKLLVFVTTFCLLFSQAQLIVLAAAAPSTPSCTPGAQGCPLTQDEQQALDNYPNWVADACAASSSTGPTTVTGGVPFDDSQSSDTGNQTTIDDDGIDPSPTNSPDHQSSTSYADGRLGALHTNYIALNPGWAQAHGLVLGDVAALTYQGKTIYAVYGDNHVGNTVHSEISVAAAKALGTSGNDSLTGVHTNVYPGTNTQLAGSVDQSKIDQIGAQVSGGGSPGGGPAASGPGSCCATSGAGGDVTTLTGSDNEHKAFNFLIAEGLSPAQSVGILANLVNESGVDPTNGAPPTNNVGFGIVQWTFTTRQAPLIAFAASQGKPVTDLLVQLQFMWHELNTDYKSSLDSVKQITGNDANAASQVAVSFRDSYEACDMTYTSCSDRGSVAATMFPQYATGGSPGGPTGGSCPTTTAAGFTSPFPGGWTPNRLDMGYDGTFKGQIVAPFSGTITFAANSFSNWGGYMEIKADQQPQGLPTSTLYFAEGLKPIVTSGKVAAGTPIADPAPSPYGNAYGTTSDGSGQIEWGVAVDGSAGTPTDPLAESSATLSALNLKPDKMVLAFAQWAEQTFQLPPPSQTGSAGYP